MNLICRIFGHDMKKGWAGAWRGMVYNRETCRRCGHEHSYYSTPVKKVEGGKFL